MTKLFRKIVAIVTSLTVVTMLVPAGTVGAVTVGELQARIDALLAQLAQLQAQLRTLEGGAAAGGAIVGVPAGFTFEKNLYYGMSNIDVKYLQIVLNSDSATQLASSGAGSPGSETQYFGPLTKAAIVKFQEKYASEILASWGLTKGTGYVGSTTRAKLNSLLIAAGEQEEEEEEEEEVVGEGLTVALADDNPASTVIVADSGGTTESAQSMIPFLKVKLTNGDASDVKVTKINFKRGGISADADTSQAYLYEGETLLAEYSSYSSAVLTFSSSAGLVTIPAGKSKTVTLKADLANNTASGKTIRFSIQAASDIVSDASAVNGTFPLTGNYMSTAQAADVGQLTVATTTAAGTTVDPQDGLEVYNLNLTAADQKLEVRKIKFTNIGSTAYTDLNNFKLYDGGTLVATVENMASDKTLTFDLTDAPLVIDKGVTKNMHLKADIIAGTNRTFQFSIQEMVDISVYDTGYGVYVKPNKADSWTVFKMAASTINTGKLTLTRASDSPSGNVALGATNVTVAKFDVKATGEDVKVTAMTTKMGGTNMGSDGLYQEKIYFDGSQKGTTETAVSTANTVDGAAAETFSFGNTFIVPADGNTHTLEIKVDIKTSTGAAHDGDEQFAVKIDSVTAVGRSSLQTVSVGTALGFTLNITTGDLSYVKNQAYSNWTAANSTGVAGATEVLVGSFVVTAGASEGADITSVKVKFATTTNTILQNLKLYKGDTQIGSTLGTFSANTSYTFYPSPYISLAAGAQFVLDVKADILTGATAGANGNITLQETAGVGKVTARSVTYTSDVTGQTIYIAGAGTVALTRDASSPVSDIVVMGTSEQSFAIFKYSASTSAENIKITSIIATTTLSNSPTSSVNNIKLVSDGWSATLAALDANGVASFNVASNPLVITAGTEKTVTVKANVAAYPYASSTGTIKFGIATTTYQGEVSGTATNTVAAANWKEGYAMKVYRTKPTVAFIGPSGTLTDGTHTLLEFKVTADAGQDVNIYSFNFGIVLTDNATATDLYIANITLYDKADLTTPLNNRVATSTNSGAYGASTTVANSDFGKNDVSLSRSGDIEVFYDATTTIMDIIPKGTSVTYVVKAAVHNSAQYDSITMRVSDLSTSDKNALRWGDQWVAGIDSTYVKILPTDYASLSR